MEKHKKYLHEFLAVILILGALAGTFFGVLSEPKIAQAATYTFQQNSWSGGATSNNAVHPTNQSDWNQYSTSTSGLTIGADIKITQSSYTFTDDGATSTTSGTAAGGGFGNGTNSSTAVSGSETGASVSLTKTVTANTWSVMTNAPGLFSHGDMAYDGSGNIFAFQGYSTATFWKYTISTNTWSTMTSAPGGINRSSLAYDGSGNIYAYPGDNTATFWKYTISTNTWSTMTNAPGGINGGDLTHDGSGSIYAFRGSFTTAFWKYTISSNTWSIMAVAPTTIEYEGSLAYDGSGNIYAYPGDNTATFWKYTISTNTWSTMTSAPGGIDSRSLAYDGSGSIYAFRGDGTNTFWKYAISSNTWSVMTVAPGTVNDNGSLAYDGSGSIYAFRGNSTTAFWKYNIYDNYSSPGNFTSATIDLGSSAGLQQLTWNPASQSAGTSLQYQVAANNDNATWNYVGPDGTTSTYFTGSAGSEGWSVMTVAPGTVNNGSRDLAYDGSGSIYAFRGNSTTDFWKYTISTNTWSIMTSAPGVIHGSLAYDGSGSIYALRAANTVNFWKYIISTNTWSTMANAPEAVYSNGHSLAYDGSGSVYAFRGGDTTTFWKYAISTNTWSVMTVAPGTVYGGSSLTYDGSGSIYAFRGNSTTDFWKYAISTNTWSVMTVAPGAVYQGGSSTYGSGSIYAFRGGDTTTFWKYNINNLAGAGLSNKRYVRYKAYLTGVSAWSVMTVAPGAVSYGGSSTYGSGSIYAFQGGNTTTFWKYAISTNTWSVMTVAPGTVYTGSSLTYDGSGSIYAFRGNSTTDFWKYAISTNTWSTMTSAPAIVSGGGTSLAYDGSGNIYAFEGDGISTAFWKYTISTNTWSTMAVAPATVYISSSLVYDGSGNIYANRSSNSVLFWKYTISTNTWSTMASVPTGGMNYGSLAYDGSGSIYAFQGGVTTTFWKYAISTNTWSVMTVAPGTVYYGSSLAYDGSGSIYAFRGNTTTAFWKYNINTRSAPSFTDATISYTQYPSSGELISSRYDASDAANLIAKISWNETATSTTNKVRLQIRSSPDGSTWSEWCGYADTGSTCAGTNYFDFDKNNVTLGTDNPLRNNNNDRYLQYKVRLESDSAGTAVADNVVITYVVNAAPQFDASYGTNGILISSQIATSTDNNWGKMEIWHRVEDTDTLTGATPNKLATTFDYRLNSSAGWTAIPLANLNPSSTSTRIAANSYNTTSTIWDAPSQISGNYSTTTQIRVTANDSEAANNIASSTSAAFTLDTKVPTAGGLTFDSSAGATTGNILGYTFADDSNIQYRISNNADFSADNNSRNDWQTLNASSTGASSTTWITPAASGATEKVYYQARDAYGNTMASGTVTAPGIGTQNLAGINLKDVSNTNTGQWQEFISWSPYTSETDATFASYKLYRSTDGANYSLLTTITASSTNYYTDTSVSSSTDYYYKIKVTDTDGDVSEFSASADDVVDGQGGTDIVAPIISNASSTEVQSTWAKITWTTDEYSDSKVLYGTATGNYTASSSVDTLLASSTPHAVYLTGLTPGATYYFMVRSKDIVNNSADSSEYSFTTIPGVTISDVACIDQTGTSLSVIWNTNQATVSSAVEYSANASLASYSSASVSAVSSVSNNYYQQKAPITGLSQGLPYYFRVKSTNSGGNVSIDNNSGNFYICRTTRDTKPPVISGVATPVLTDSSAVVIWTTDEPASSKVEYGTTASSTAGSYATSTIQDSTLTTSHVVTLTGLIKETKYYYRVRSNDLNTGNSDAVSNENEFTTAAERQTIIVYVGAAVVSNAATAGDMTGPVISDIKVESVGSFDAVISFSTNEDATAFIDYGETNGYGTTVGSSQFSTSHRFKLTGLKMGTQYHFKAKAIDKANNFSDAGDETFTTKYFTEALQDLITLERASQFQEAIEKSIESILPSLLPPFIEKPRVTDITENSAILRWKTNIKSYSVALYAGDKDFNASAVNPYTGEVSDTETKTVDHEIALTGLSPSTQYHFMVKSFILPQVMGRSEDMTFITKSSPIKPRIADIDNDAITIAWITDSLASSIVEYKNLQTNEINRKTNEFLTKDHNVKIENLTPDTSYEIQAMGYGEKGNLIEAGEAITARTSRDVTPPTLSNLRIDSAMVSGRTDRVQTIVSWKTDEPANSFVEYEEGSGKGDGTLANKSGDSDVFVQDHNVIITKLKPGLLYRIKVISVDDANNKTVSPIRTIITPRQTESIVDVIVKNFEDTFQFLQKIR